MREPRDVSSDMKKKKEQVQDSILILFTELSMLSPNLKKTIMNQYLIITEHWFHQYVKHKCIQMNLTYRQGKNGLLTLLDVPFPFLLLQWLIFLSIGQEKSFALAHLTSNFLTREIYFPGNGKGQCILRKPWKIGPSLNNPCLSLSSLQTSKLENFT